MLFDEANFIAELFWHASSPIWCDTFCLSLLIRTDAPNFNFIRCLHSCAVIKLSKLATSWQLPTRIIWSVRKPHIQFVHYKLVRLQETYNFITTYLYIQIMYYNLVAPKLYVLVQNIQFDIYQFVCIKHHTIWMIPFCINYFTGRFETYNLTSTNLSHYRIFTILWRCQVVLVISQDIQIEVYQLSYFDSSQHDVDVWNQPTGIDDVLHADWERRSSSALDVL